MISGYLITILITIVIYAMLAHSLNIITGHAGQISLGHAAFFGIGAYTLGPALFGGRVSILDLRPSGCPRGRDRWGPPGNSLFTRPG